MSASGYSQLTLPQVPPGYVLQFVSVQEGSNNLSEFLQSYPAVASSNQVEDQESQSSEMNEFFCTTCNTNSEEPCWDHADAVKDHAVELAVITLPDCLFFDHKPGMPDKGVFARTAIAAQTVFGPLIAPIRKTFVEDTTLALPFSDLGKKDAVYFDLRSSHTCNWMKFVRFAETRAQQNVAVCIRDTDIYFVTIRLVPPREEIRVAFSGKYSAVLDEAFLQERVMPFEAVGGHQIVAVLASGSQEAAAPELPVPVPNSPQKHPTPRKSAHAPQTTEEPTSKRGQTTPSRAFTRPMIPAAKKSVVPPSRSSVVRKSQTPSEPIRLPVKPSKTMESDPSAGAAPQPTVSPLSVTSYGLRSKRASIPAEEFFLDSRGKPVVFNGSYSDTVSPAPSPAQGLRERASRKRNKVVVDVSVDERDESMDIVPITPKSRNNPPRVSERSRRDAGGKRSKSVAERTVNLFGHNFEDHSEDDADWAMTDSSTRSRRSSLSRSTGLSSDISSSAITESERSFPAQKRSPAKTHRKAASTQNGSRTPTKTVVRHSPEIDNAVCIESREGSEEIEQVPAPKKAKVVPVLTNVKSGKKAEVLMK
ncbi:nucleolar protein dao-5-like [Paramacrobiotus metropolitanus]|uniref:nucleolar protein dao-5-like n=1 Tax=Paramacrobiotus metropolitanus TaxID=2943436 RepID=UPI0024456FBF|nr:nucleolar protein dao-5-like [Paramacrobiotus metropolitanus]